MTLRTYLTILTTTTALVAASATGASAQQEASSGQDMDLSADAQPLDITTHLRAMHGLSIVNHRGHALGQLYDVVIDFSEKEVIYALMSAGGQAEDWPTGEAATEQAAENVEPEEEGQQEQARAGSLYPIPIEAIRIVDRSTLEPQVAQGQQQTVEGQQQTAEGQQPTAEGQQQMAEGQQPAAEGQQPAAEGQQQMAEGQQQMAEQQRPQSLDEMTVGTVIGMQVVSDTGEPIADVDDIIVGADNQPLVVLGVGGFLGIGEKTVGVPLDRTALAPEADALVISVTREQLEEAPELEYDESQSLSEDTPVAELTGAGQQGQQQGQAAQQQGQQAAEGQEAGQTTAGAEGEPAAQAGEITSLEGKVLMVSIEAEKLQQAPSFEEGNFPEIADPEWQKSVLAFYEDLLGEERSIEVEVQTETEAGAETEGEEQDTAQ